MSHPSDTISWTDRLVAAAMVPIFGVAGLAFGWSALLGQDRCAYNDSGRSCDPGPWIGRSMLLVGGVACAGALLVFASRMAGIALGQPTARSAVRIGRIGIVGLALFAAGVLILRSVDA